MHLYQFDILFKFFPISRGLVEAVSYSSSGGFKLKNFLMIFCEFSEFSFVNASKISLFHSCIPLSISFLIEQIFDLEVSH